MRYAIERMGEMRNAYTNLTRKPKNRKPMEDNNRMDMKQMLCGVLVQMTMLFFRVVKPSSLVGTHGVTTEELHRHPHRRENLTSHVGPNGSGWRQKVGFYENDNEPLGSNFLTIN
jgi:hypothetical protein